MKEDPLKKFEELYSLETSQAQTKIPGACCLSTVGIDGYPNARFLALKMVNEQGFIITGSLSTKKGEEIANNPKVSLTFWWQTTGIQVRIQGDAHQISRELASNFFYERSRRSQIISLASDQGKPVEKIEDLVGRLNKITEQFKNKDIPCPENWGGFIIMPIRIEFLEFHDDRLHSRILYSKLAECWKAECIQP